MRPQVAIAAHGKGLRGAKPSFPWERHVYGRPPARDGLSRENPEHLGYVDVQTDSISVREEGEHDPVWLHL